MQEELRELERHISTFNTVTTVTSSPFVSGLRYTLDRDDNEVSNDVAHAFRMVAADHLSPSGNVFSVSSKKSTRCSFCGNRKEASKISNGICDSCRDTYERCGSCAHYRTKEEIYSFRGNRYCYSCINPIRQYSTNVIAEKRWRSRSASELYFGVELELSSPRTDLKPLAIKALNLVDEFAIIKSDSSIVNGFEIVSVPAKPSKIAGLWEPFFKNVPKGLVGYRGNCGMHVHVTRRALSSELIRKLSVFLNSKENIKLIEYASSRHLNRYCKQNPYLSIGDKVALTASDRYTILNTTRTDTIEFRSFKSTIRFDQFKRNIEFVRACLDFCNLTSPNALRYINFNKYVVEHKKKYPILAKAITRWFKYQQITTTKPSPVSTFWAMTEASYFAGGS